MNFVIYNGDGRILRTGSCPDDELENQAASGETAMEAPEDARDNTHFVLDGVLVAMPERPSANHTFDYEAKAWVDPRTVQQLRTQAKDRINAERDRRERLGFMYRGKLFQSDELSVLRIGNAAGAALAKTLLGESVAITWTTADNTGMELDGPGLVGLQGALVVNAATLHQVANYLKGLVDAASTSDAMDAIVWPAP